MSKKIIGLLVIVFSVFCCILGGTACNKNQEEQAFTLKINESNIVITEFFNEQLTTNYSGEGTVQWSVENESIISVNNGNVKGISAGSSKVFAEVDGKKAETLVTVKAFDENLLSIDLERYVISLEVGEAKTIQPKMQYDGKDIESAFSYESLASDYFTVDANGKIIALKLGQKTCIITGVFNGYEKSISLNVDVISNTSISFASDSVYLYTENLDNEHPSKQQINLTVRENGKIIEQPDIEYIQAVDQDVYVVEDGQIVAKNAGSSKLTVSYTDSKNVCITKDVAVIVKPVDKKVNDKLTIETDGEYEIDINEFVNTSDEVKGLYTLTKDGLKTVASYEAGLITFASVVYGQVSIVAETRNVNYFIDADIDWQIFITNDNVELLKGVSGESIYLSEDIDLNNQNWSSLADYSGNFDGQGFAIKNISVADSSGLFKSFNGTIKDVKFENVTLNGNSGVLAYSSQNANIENVVVLISNVVDAMQAGGLFAKTDDATIVVKNSIISLAKTVSDKIGYVAGLASGTQTYDEVLFIGGNSLINGNKDGFVATVDGSYNIKNDALDAYKDLSVSVVTEEEFAVLFGITFINDQNKTLLNSLKGNENIILTSNLNLSTITWQNTVNFTGTFDGNGYKIIGLKPKDATGYALFQKFGGTIRNVCFTNVKLNTRTAVVGYGISGHAFVENVSVEIDTITYGYLDKLYYVGGIFGDLHNNSYSIENITVTLKDVLVSAPTETVNSSGGNAIPLVSEDGDDKNNQFGFVTGCISANALTMENCYFVGGSGRINGYYDTTTKPSLTTGTINSEYFVFADADAFALAFNDGDNDFEMSEFIKVACENLISPEKTEINQENISDLLNLVGNEYVVLTSDLDFSSISSWNTQVAFSGTLDGQGHVIKNFKTNTNLGLFKSISGTVKNVAFTGVVLGPGASTLAKSMSGNTIIENVIINLSSKNDGYNPSALIGNVKPNVKATYTLSNVVINCPSTTDETFGFVGGYGHNVDVLINDCYFVGGNGKLFGYKVDNGTELKPTSITGDVDSDYFVYEDLTSFESVIQSMQFSAELSALYNKVFDK